MVDFSRYRGIVAVGMSLLVTLAILDGMLRATFGRSPPWLSTDQHPNEWEDLEAAGSKVAGVARLSRLSQTNGEQQPRPSLGRLGVILGRSTSREDLDPNILEAGCGASFRWLSLYGAGGSLTYMEDFDQLLALANLQPAIVIFAINPHMLVGRPAMIERNALNPKDIAYDIRAGKWRRAEQEAEDFLESESWILTNRPFLNQQFRRTIHEIRLQVFARCDLDIQSLFPADPDPWTVQLLGYPLHKSQDFLDEYWQKAAWFGWFDPQRYEPSTPQATSLVRQIGNWQARGSQVFIILLPEKTSWRTQIPGEAKANLLTVLQENFGEKAPPVIDLRETMSDEMFTDFLHLNEPGRKAFSRLFATRLCALLAEAKAQQSNSANE